MSDRFQLRIVTPRRLVLDEAVREVTAPGTVGQFGVLPNHITFLSTLETGILEYRVESGQRSLAIQGGFAEVSDDVMTILTESAESPDDVDATQAEQDLRAAAQQMETLSPIDEEYVLADRRRLWAQTRLDLARKR